MSLGLNRRDRIAVLVLGILLLLLLVADRWISLTPASPHPSATNDAPGLKNLPGRKDAYASTNAQNRKGAYGSTYFPSRKDIYASTNIPNRKGAYDSAYFPGRKDASKPSYSPGGNPSGSFYKKGSYNYYNPASYPKGSQYAKAYPKKVVLINLNDADSSSLIPLPGIGPALASRIIKYRNKLGGFYSIQQIKETYGVTDSVFNLIADMVIVKDSSWVLMSINSITVDELKLHPYFKWQIANAIISYRNAHGAFTNIDDLKKIATINEELLIKIKPYLSFE